MSVEYLSQMPVINVRCLKTRNAVCAKGQGFKKGFECHSFVIMAGTVIWRGSAIVFNFCLWVLCSSVLNYLFY